MFLHAPTCRAPLLKCCCVPSFSLFLCAAQMKGREVQYDVSTPIPLSPAHDLSLNGRVKLTLDLISFKFTAKAGFNIDEVVQRQRPFLCPRRCLLTASSCLAALGVRTPRPSPAGLP